MTTMNHHWMLFSPRTRHLITDGLGPYGGFCLFKHELLVWWFLLRVRYRAEIQRAVPCCFWAGAIVVIRLVDGERGGGLEEGLYLPKADLLWSILTDTLMLQSTDTKLQVCPWETFRCLKDICCCFLFMGQKIVLTCSDCFHKDITHQNNRWWRRKSSDGVNVFTLWSHYNTQLNSKHVV